MIVIQKLKKKGVMTKETKTEVKLKGLAEGIYLRCSGTYYSEYRGNVDNETFQAYVLFSTDHSINMEDYKNTLLSHVQNRLINPYLKSNPVKYPHFYKCRECRIEEIIYNFTTNTKNIKPKILQVSMVNEMTIDELKTFVLQSGIKTKIDNFSTIFKAREAVKRDFENKKIADKHKKQRIAKEKEKAKANA